MRAVESRHPNSAARVTALPPPDGRMERGKTRPAAIARCRILRERSGICQATAAVILEHLLDKLFARLLIKAIALSVSPSVAPVAGVMADAGVPSRLSGEAEAAVKAAGNPECMQPPADLNIAMEPREP